MKKIIVFLAFLFSTVSLFSQTPVFPNYYLQKSKTQNTVGWIMAVGGISMVAVGSVIANHELNKDPIGYFLSGGGSSTAVILAGVGVTLGSIPFFISSAKNRRFAAQVGFNDRKILVPMQNAFVPKMQPAVTLKIVL